MYTNAHHCLNVRNATTAKKGIGVPAKLKEGAHGGTWVQTERSAHEAWALLGLKSPIAAAVLHTLVARMGKENAVVIPQKLLGKLLGVSDRTVRTGVQLLVAERWIQVVKLNGPGTVNAYVINSSVVWGDKRENLHTATFRATVVTDAADQYRLEHVNLRKIPMLYAYEMQLPSGPREAHPSRPSLTGLDPDLPKLRHNGDIDLETGEIQLHQV